MFIEWLLLLPSLINTQKDRWLPVLEIVAEVGLVDGVIVPLLLLLLLLLMLWLLWFDTAMGRKPCQFNIVEECRTCGGTVEDTAATLVPQKIRLPHRMMLLLLPTNEEVQVVMVLFTV